MKELAAVLLAVLSIAAYFVLATEFGAYQRWPAASFLGCLAALALLVRLTVVGTGGRRLLAGAALGFVLVLSSAFAWYTLAYSSYATAAPAVAVGDALGERLAGLRLAAVGGGAEPLLRPGTDRGTLIVLYRGYW